MDEFEQLRENMKTAKEEQSEHCTKGAEHDFQFMAHSDSRDSFSYYFRCANCSEVIVRTQQRTGSNKKLWQ